MKESEKTRIHKREEIRKNIILVVAVCGVMAAGWGVWQTEKQLVQVEEQLNIAKQQVSVPQFVEAIKLLERSSFLSKKSAIKMLERLAVSNQEYSQQSLNILLGITSKYMKGKRCSDIMKKLKNAKNNTQEEIINKTLDVIANIIKKSKNLNLDNAWLYGLKILSDKKIKIFANLNKAKLNGAELKNIIFSNSNLSDVNFEGAILTNVTFNESNKLSNVKFFDTIDLKTSSGTEKETYTVDYKSRSLRCNIYIEPDMRTPGPPCFEPLKIPKEKTRIIKLYDKKGINQTYFNNVDFSNTNLENVDFGCELKEGNLDLSRVEFSKNNKPKCEK